MGKACQLQEKIHHHHHLLNVSLTKTRANHAKKQRGKGAYTYSTRDIPRSSPPILYICHAFQIHFSDCRLQINSKIPNTLLLCLAAFEKSNKHAKRRVLAKEVVLLMKISGKWLDRKFKS